MNWRGNNSPGPFSFGGWSRAGFISLGQPQGECIDGRCYVITTILDEPTSKALYAKINQAILENSSCIDSSGHQDAQVRLIGKLRKVENGTAPALNAPLRKDEADYAAKFNACYVPAVQVTDDLPVATTTAELPVVPIAIGAGALVLLLALS